MTLNMLVVDDSAVMRSVIIKTLRLSGLQIGEVHQAGNGVEALKVLHENWVDLALVDLNMPVMNGEELINEVRQNKETSDLNIIVVSTEGSERRINSLREKRVEFIHKPFVPEDLREMVFKLTGVENEQQHNGFADASGDFDF
ncbi:MAG: response regulator [Blastocatellia bacterium]|nr:response regulator [Blastocatellia bacterium]